MSDTKTIYLNCFNVNFSCNKVMSKCVIALKATLTTVTSIQVVINN